MMQNQATCRQDTRHCDLGRKPQVPPLSLQKAIPEDWHRDPPAFAGDPFMDWESLPEPPHP